MSRRERSAASAHAGLELQARQRANAKATQTHPLLERHRKARERRLRVPTWSLPADKVLKVIAVVVVVAMAWAYRADLLAWWPL